ncbi:hypothetical protein CHRY9390_02805 [Chryseobacterium aquaeductus]|uniref:Uncharacterized protein n=1 Tax=Chryseobacterium aquaeductus TaxID=2675056 RepID=A0A9N8QTH3_9FLAO|nr:hypothetical protein [Chryseobacterium aquaeductus]CAA7332084.1 hypothetical protein CHRY9390_02805 [Chryseobacterium potabilaquae]CAD7814439.1 hypothetical protein CHRY9390_02805 [Chryseobacterium aquaeductus]
MKAHTFFLIIMLFCNYKIKAQEHFLLPDSPPKCHLIKEGKFIKQGDSAKKWNIVIKKDSQREYTNNGKDYIKYKIEFLDDCTYKTTVIGKSDGKNPIRIGDFITNKIIETDHQFIKISSQYFNKTDEFVLEKIE